MTDNEIAGWLGRWRHRRVHRAQARPGEQAAAVGAPRRPRLADSEHVIILIQENRSFDHYFGTLSGVRGFSDHAVPLQSAGGGRHTIFDQFGYQPGKGPDAAGYLQPFRLLSDPPDRDGQSTNDISDTRPTQHLSWSGGAPDGMVAAH